MPYLDPSRRSFLQLSGAAGLAAWMTLALSGCRDAAESAADALSRSEEPRILGPEEWRTLEVLSDTVLPPDGDRPGATAMGAVVFMDHYLAERPLQLDEARQAVATLDARAREVQSGAGGFVDLDRAAREALLDDLGESDPQAYFPLWLLVVCGAFSNPAHGGNRDKAGWTLLGFEDRHAWQPPFGLYDAQAAAQGGDA